MNREKVLSASEKELALREAGFGPEVVEGARDLAVMLEAVPTSLVDETMKRLEALKPSTPASAQASEKKLGQSLMVLGTLAMGMVCGILIEVWRTSGAAPVAVADTTPHAVEVVCSLPGEDARHWRAVPMKFPTSEPKPNTEALFSVAASAIECGSKGKLLIRLDQSESNAPVQRQGASVPASATSQ